MTILNKKFIYSLIIAVFAGALFLVLPSKNSAQVAPAPSPPAQPAQVAQEDGSRKQGFLSKFLGGIQNLLGIGPGPAVTSITKVPPTSKGGGTDWDSIISIFPEFPPNLPLGGLLPNPRLAYLHMNTLSPPYNLWPPVKTRPDAPVCIPGNCDNIFVFGINPRDPDKRNNHFSFNASSDLFSEKEHTEKPIEVSLIIFGGPGGSGTDGAMPMARVKFNIINDSGEYEIRGKEFDQIPPIATGPDGTRYYAAVFKVPPLSPPTHVAIAFQNTTIKMDSKDKGFFVDMIKNTPPDYTFAKLLQEDPLPSWKTNMINLFLHGHPLFGVKGYVARINEYSASATADGEMTIEEEITLNFMGWLKDAIVGQIKNETMDLGDALQWAYAQWSADHSPGGKQSYIGFVVGYLNIIDNNLQDAIEDFKNDWPNAIRNLAALMQDAIANNGYGYQTVLTKTGQLLSLLKN